jgi:hypothetical protein
MLLQVQKANVASIDAFRRNERNANHRARPHTFLKIPLFHHESSPTSHSYFYCSRAQFLHSHKGKNHTPTMEVASPLTFGHSTAGAKRHLPCSPGFVDSTNRSPFSMVEPAEEFVQRAFKRRRFTVDENMESETENTMNQSPFTSHSVQQKSLFSSSNGKFVMVDFARCPLIRLWGFTSRLRDVTAVLLCPLLEKRVDQIIYVVLSVHVFPRANRGMSSPPDTVVSKRWSIDRVGSSSLVYEYGEVCVLKILDAESCGPGSVSTFLLCLANSHIRSQIVFYLYRPIIQEMQSRSNLSSK